MEELFGTDEKEGLLDRYSAYSTAEQLKAQNGGVPCTAHDIYYGMSEIVFMVACSGASGTKIVQAEETVARALSARWQEYDIPGDFKW